MGHFIINNFLYINRISLSQIEKQSKENKIGL